MQSLIYISLLAVFSIDYLAGAVQLIPARADLLTELLSLLGTILIIGVLSQRRSLALSAKYAIFFFLLGVHIINGIVINGTPSGAIVAGLRVYLKYVPFFFVPVVYEFSEASILRQMKLILLLCGIQLPVAVYQRFFQYDIESGDGVTGTMETSSFLSMLLVSAMAMVLAFYVKGRITLKTGFVLLLMLFIPTTINETKGTIVLLPLVVVAIWLKSGSKVDVKKRVAILAVFGVMAGGFIAVYDHYWGSRYGEEGSVIDFYTSDKVIRYLAPKSSGMVTNESGPVGKIDKVVAPIKTLSNDPVKVLVGLGIGNVTKTRKSFLSGDFTGDDVQKMVGSAISYMLWELGVIGVLLTAVFIVMVYKDASYLSKRDGLLGAIALGWAATMPLVAVSLFYKNVITGNALMFLFWYWSGYLAAQRYRMGMLELESGDSYKNKENGTFGAYSRR